MILYDPLWRMMEKNKITMEDLQKKYGISDAIAKRLYSNLPISTRVIDKLCNIFKCNLRDIIEYVPDKKE